MTALRIPHTRAGAWPEIRAGRFAAGIRRDTPEGCRVALLGLPDDTGVRLNGGRPGAAQGPSAFRAALAGFGTSFDGLTGKAIETRVFDAGDIEPADGTSEAALFETHARVAAAATELHQLGLLPVCIGGGHDLTLPTVTAFSRAIGRPVGGINVDAHLDVRARVGSGMPFRRLIEANCLDARAFIEVGLGRFVNDAADWTWIAERGATLIGVESVLDGRPSARELLDLALAGASSGSANAGEAFLSVDLDALDASIAPGVSAQNPFGLGVRPVAALVEAAGAEPRLGHFDLMELSPPHDLGDRTARIAAYLFLVFIAGFERRS